MEKIKQALQHFISFITPKLLGPVSCGSVYGPEKPVYAKGYLKGERFDWKFPADKDPVPDAVAVPMDYFVFRLIDIPPENRDVLAGQISRFLPFPDSDVVWHLIPVAGRSFIMAMTGKQWKQIISGLKAGRQKQPFVIPALVAAALYHVWNHDDSEELAVPAGNGYLLMSIKNSSVNKIDFCETLHKEDNKRKVVVYDDDKLIACGAALYPLAPHKFDCDLSGRKPVAALTLRAFASVAIFCCMLLFFLYTVYARDMAMIKKVTDALDIIKKQTGRVETIMSRNEKIETTVEFLEKVNKNYISPYLVLGDIASILPEETYLMEFFIDAGKGHITGVSRDVTAVLETISERFYISTAEFTTPVVRDRKGMERFQISFEVTKGDQG